MLEKTGGTTTLWQCYRKARLGYENVLPVLLGAACEFEAARETITVKKP